MSATRRNRTEPHEAHPPRPARGHQRSSARPGAGPDPWRHIGELLTRTLPLRTLTADRTLNAERIITAEGLRRRGAPDRHRSTRVRTDKPAGQARGVERL